MNKLDWISTMCSGGSFICELALKMLELSIFKVHNVAGTEAETPINEILLYGADNEEHMKEIGLNNLLCIYYVILHANKSVDVCVPSLASETLAKCLITVHQKSKAKIRIVIHNSDDFDNLQLFGQHGIEVKIINPDVPLEHEFLLVDASDEFKDAVAVMGSLDYETSRVNCNRDATVLTSEVTVVTTLKREFDRVWHSITDIPFTKVDIVKE